MTQNIILIAKAIHVIGFISWFAGLFYLVRILVYHSETDQRPKEEAKILRKEFIGMEQRVYKIIVNPAMMITWAAGLTMIIVGWNSMPYFQMGTPGWLHVKLFLLVLLVGYQVYTNRRLMIPMEKGERPMTGWQLRLWNEVPTFFLVSISFIAVFGKAGNLSYLYLVIGVLLFATMVYRGAMAYRKRRNKIVKAD